MQANSRLKRAIREWGQFGAVVDGQFRTLAALGIASIDLTPDNRVVRFSDGSAISGTSRFTRTDGSTGLAADVSLANAAEGFRLAQETGTDATGATRLTTRVFDTAGVLRERHMRVTSADGATVTTTSDLDGDGVDDARQEIVVTQANGERTETVRLFDAAGRLLSRVATTTTADFARVTLREDLDGDAADDRVTTTFTRADGVRVELVSLLNPDGTTRSSVRTETQPDGRSFTRSFDDDGDGTSERRTAVVQAAGANGAVTVTTRELRGQGAGTLASASTVTLAADGLSATRTFDDDGDGVDDRKVTETSQRLSDRIRTLTRTEALTGAGALLVRLEDTETSFDGVVLSRKVSADGDETFERVETTRLSTAADGALSDRSSPSRTTRAALDDQNDSALAQKHRFVKRPSIGLMCSRKRDRLITVGC